MTRHRGWALLVGALVLITMLLASACASGGASRERIEIEASDFSFEPAVVTVSAGTEYSLVFRNSGTVLHDWTIERIPATDVAETGSAGHGMSGMGGMAGAGGQLHVAAEAGKTSELAFTPTTPGEYEYVCTVPGHRELGMLGRLVVQG